MTPGAPPPAGGRVCWLRGRAPGARQDISASQDDVVGKRGNHFEKRAPVTLRSTRGNTSSSRAAFRGHSWIAQGEGLWGAVSRRRSPLCSSLGADAALRCSVGRPRGGGREPEAGSGRPGTAVAHSPRAQRRASGETEATPGTWNTRPSWAAGGPRVKQGGWASARPRSGE